MKNVWKIKKRLKNVKNVTKIKNVKTFLHILFSGWPREPRIRWGLGSPKRMSIIWEHFLVNCEGGSSDTACRCQPVSLPVLQQLVYYYLVVTCVQVVSGYRCRCCDGFAGVACTDGQSNTTAALTDCGTQCSSSPDAGSADR